MKYRILHHSQKYVSQYYQPIVDKWITIGNHTTLQEAKLIIVRFANTMLDIELVEEV